MPSNRSKHGDVSYELSNQPYNQSSNKHRKSTIIEFPTSKEGREMGDGDEREDEKNENGAPSKEIEQDTKPTRRRLVRSLKPIICTPSSYYPPTDPRKFIRSPVDVAKTLDNYFLLHKDRETNKDMETTSISVTGINEAVFISIDKIKARAEVRSPPGFNPVFGYCAQLGLDYLLNHRTIRQSMDLKEQFDSSSSSSDLAESFIWSIFNHQKMDFILGGGKRRSVTIPVSVRNKLSNYSAALGLPLSSFSLLCVCTTLSVQPLVTPSTRDRFASQVSSFLELAQIRVRGTVAVIKELLGGEE